MTAERFRKTDHPPALQGARDWPCKENYTRKSPLVTLHHYSQCFRALCGFQTGLDRKKKRLSKLLLFLPTLLPGKIIPDELYLFHTQPFAAWRSRAQPGCSTLSRVAWPSSSECSVVDEPSDRLSASAPAEERICFWHCCPNAIKLLLTVDRNSCSSRKG